MANRVERLPFFVVLVGLAALAMWVPAIHAAMVRDWPVARAFFYSGILFLILCTLIGAATGGVTPRIRARSHLVALVAAYTVLPGVLAVPFHQAVGNTHFLSAWFEMVSSFTTTGASLYPAERLSASVHLWRGIVGWSGGLFIWITAIAVLEPLNLGGFEVLNRQQSGDTASTAQIEAVAGTGRRLKNFALRLTPIYGVLTLILWASLSVAGAQPFDAFMMAMATMATSGITATAAPPGTGGEVIIFLFLFLAVSRTFHTGDVASLRRTRTDPEIRIALACVAGVSLLLVLRHWAGAYDVDDVNNLAAAAGALWGTMFTLLSFLTTNGMVSTAWEGARAWSGLETPGLVLMGLAVFGGGVATTAGGVKLLRIYALYAHGTRELERLVNPSSVGGSGSHERHLRRRGAHIAWIFFMLFAMSIAVVMAALSLSGVSFEQTIVLTIAALTTTGPLAAVAAEQPISYVNLGSGARAVLAAAMVLGRLETLALIALFNPDFWRR